VSRAGDEKGAGGLSRVRVAGLVWCGDDKGWWGDDGGDKGE
jgi:hypothetical protein